MYKKQEHIFKKLGNKNFKFRNHSAKILMVDIIIHVRKICHGFLSLFL